MSITWKRVEIDADMWAEDPEYMKRIWGGRYEKGQYESADGRFFIKKDDMTYASFHLYDRNNPIRYNVSLNSTPRMKLSSNYSAQQCNGQALAKVKAYAEAVLAREATEAAQA